ncbi:DUF3306 domain-containing protein [Hydrogenophilus thiooxidans]|uniref:DUF3306 domain-containing protein n=1 Tax=Hydrogenophilus thiooxidans TaxID=2820326 RepID=UPI001C2311F7|nr:DUF3306 domain-containing protein [Hydrogenophilus thiooxidans]
MIDWRGWAQRKRLTHESEAVARWRATLAALPPDGDLTPFLASEVPEAVRQEALQRLWATGAFGQPDGLDSDFIDVTKDPLLSEDEARALVQWQNVTSGLHREEEQSHDGGDTRSASPDDEEMAPLPVETEAQKLNGDEAKDRSQPIEETARFVSPYLFVNTKAS